MVIKRILILLFTLLISSISLVGCSEKPIDPGKEEKDPKGNQVVEEREMTNHAVYDGVQLPDDLWTKPSVIEDSTKDRKESNLSGQIKGIYYRSDYDGVESYAFAYLGIPNGVSKENKAPAVLLVHGGGGTAYYQWVNKWVERGFVALAMDLEGHEPIETGTTDNMPQDLYVKTTYKAPNNQNYGDAELEIQKTWMYYAVSTAIRGNSLLHSLEYVDKYNVGVCGISWGGVITSIITGYDDRFAFSIPIYCSLNLAECKTGNLTALYKSHPKAKVWDDDEGLSRVNTPIHFISMDNDVNALPDSIGYTFQRCKNASISFIPGFLHSHTFAIARDEAYSFAEGIVKKEDKLIRITNKPTEEKGELNLVIPEGVTIKGAYLRITDSDFSSLPNWEKARLKVDGNVVSYEITDQIASYLDSEKVSYYYVYVEDSLGRVVSTSIINL